MRWMVTFCDVAGDLERAVGQLVATVTHDQERDSPSGGSRQPSVGREAESPFPVEEVEQYDNNPMPQEKDR